MKKVIITLKINKHRDNIYLKIKAAKSIEEFFKAGSEAEFKKDNISSSTKWFDEKGDGLKYYKLPTELQGNLLNKAIFDENKNRIWLRNDFGSNLVQDEGINVALLRIVGIGEGVTVSTKDLLGYEEMKLYIEKLAIVVKAFYNAYLKDLKVQAEIAFEV